MVIHKSSLSERTAQVYIGKDVVVLLNMFSSCVSAVNKPLSRIINKAFNIFQTLIYSSLSISSRNYNYSVRQNHPRNIQHASLQRLTPGAFQKNSENTSGKKFELN
jgi:hypothetical protein